MTKPTILTLCDYYLPGYKAGGPITTVSNMVALLGDEYEFKVITRNHDLGEVNAFGDVAPHTWRDIGGARVLYLRTGPSALASLDNALRAGEFDILYINSFFSPLFSIWPLALRWLDRIPRRRVVLAPRGELAMGALSLKWRKKRAFLMAARLSRLHAGVLWQASSPHEEADIRDRLGRWNSIMVAPDLLTMTLPSSAHRDWPPKSPGLLKLLYLSRVDAAKNLAGALTILQGVTGRVDFDIVGPISDSDYWARCCQLIDNLPGNVRARYLGPVPPADVARVMRAHDLLFLPTLGENFGHVIPEALAAGCPVLISDRTPWRELARRGAGWDLSLDEPQKLREVLQACIQMEATTHRRLRQTAELFARRTCGGNEAVELNRRLFRTALGHRGAAPPGLENACEDRERRLKGRAA